MLVVDVEGVLPDVDVEQGHEAEGLHICDQVLIHGGAILEALGVGVVYEPSPAGALDLSGLSVEGFDESIIRAPAVLDCLSERRRITGTGAATAGDGCQTFPEEGVVPVTTSEEAYISGNLSESGIILLGQGSIDLVELLVVLGHVRFVVTVVMVVHLSLAQHGLQGVQLVGKGNLDDPGGGSTGGEAARASLAPEEGVLVL